MPDYFDSLEWRDNSRAMFNAVLMGVPAVFRGMLRESIRKWAVGRELTVIDEDTVFEAVDDLAPPAMARDTIKPELEKLRSK